MDREKKLQVRSIPRREHPPLSLGDLPPADTRRWGIQKKAAIVLAVRGGLLSLEEACLRYSLSLEEFGAWQRQMERFGVQGLRATWAQMYRT
ncbi:hypothetical protein FHS83_003065 [Rhizomicrobium palustre]|uniref:DUF1153 domain-containing protein n=1 Tax=Rhizomicrobium palustre TaxID=189966 RepID=A0A846N3R5_9PROT|nr:DUF1153 domain-containing protein [Rhizomicrobium palustre]NIK89747.1 hypothetical protein [Rhizomicrobium palustre]